MAKGGVTTVLWLIGITFIAFAVIASLYMTGVIGPARQEVIQPTPVTVTSIQQQCEALGLVYDSTTGTCKEAGSGSGLLEGQQSSVVIRTIDLSADNSEQTNPNVNVTLWLSD